MNDNPRYILLSRFQIWCYQVDTFPNLAVLPKWFQKASSEKVIVVEFGQFDLYHMYVKF